MKLKNKVGIITGATSGMGKAMAMRMHEEGASLVLNGRNAARAEELKNTLEAKRLDSVAIMIGDVRQVATNELLVKAAIDQFGQLDFVITNAGILGLGKVTEVQVEDWHATFDTNLHSVYYLAKYSLPHLRNSRGTFIGNASIAAFKNFPNHPAYCASKAAMVALVKQMALDYGPDVRANCLCPGPVDTPLIWDSAKAFDNPEQAVAQAGEKTLLNRLGTPDDIAKLALFLVSDDASWITGTTINIDGGIMSS
ncbi:MAG: SDR family oxidoreductase [Cytophagales bacterium]|nr:SDR family oxidoreductase [Cytophagales bacterium]